MKRRQFITAIGTVSIGTTVSGCSSFNPLDNSPTPPTESQLEYIEHYPHHQRSDIEGAPVISISMAKDFVLFPASFGGYEAFEVYKVQPDGTGSQIGELTLTEYQSDNPPGHKPFSKSTVRGGTVLLVLCRTSSGERFTYGAYAEIDGRLQQVAYPEFTNDASKTTTT